LQEACGIFLKEIHPKELNPGMIISPLPDYHYQDQHAL
jgi:hypothetical protein